MTRVTILSSMRHAAVLAFAAILAASLAVPAASSSHCDTKITVYGRASLAPIVSPPYSSGTAGMCVRVLEDKIDEHLLPPNTDQVLVRVNGDFGNSITTLQLTLTGLGFTGNTYTLFRTASPFGGNMYQLAEWVSLPDGPVHGDLQASVRYPAGPRTVTYHTSATVLVPAAVVVPDV